MPAPKRESRVVVTGLNDIDTMLEEIHKLNKQYSVLTQRLEAAQQHPKSKEYRLDDAAKADLMIERDAIKNRFIEKKRATRAVVSLLPGVPEAAVRVKRLEAEHEAFRLIDANFRALGIFAERASLMSSRRGSQASGSTTARSGASSVSGGAQTPRGDPDSVAVVRPILGPTSDDLLHRTTGVQQSTLEQLRQGLSVVHTTQGVATETAAALEGDREKMQRIDKALDGIDSELAISKKLITRIIKRFYTDKIIIAFTTLLFLGVLGIIIYVAMTPGQSLFNTPADVAGPQPTPSSTPAASGAGRR